MGLLAFSAYSVYAEANGLDVGTSMYRRSFHHLYHALLVLDSSMSLILVFIGHVGHLGGAVFGGLYWLLKFRRLR